MENHKMKNELLIQIGRRLSESRTEKGVTQEQLANMTGLSIKMISAAENGHKAMRPENIVKICDSDRLSFARRDPAPYRHGRAKESEHSDIKTTGGTFKNH